MGASSVLSGKPNASHSTGFVSRRLPEVAVTVTTSPAQSSSSRGSASVCLTTTQKHLIHLIEPRPKSEVKQAGQDGFLTRPFSLRKSTMNHTTAGAARKK